MKAAYCTLGCKVNQYDTQAIQEMLEKEGYETVDFTDVADVYVINTCTVTHIGDKKSRQMISRAHTLAPDAYIVVVGCYSQRAPEEVKQLPGVSLVIGTKDRTNIVEMIKSLHKGDNAVNAVSDIRSETEFEELCAVREGKTRAQLKIQDGCDRFCTYCAIPYARGPIRSRKLDNIKKELEKLAQGGYKEVVLTGIHLMSYGKDLGGDINLIDAIKQADDINGIKRIRLGSLEPQLMTEESIKYLAENKKICRQFHLSLQSGSATVLKRMNRRYTPEKYEKCVEALRKYMPDCAITTDIIVGFPGETEEEFNETLEFVKRIRLSKIHVFPYSRRSGTVAYNMPNQIEKSIKEKRVSILSALGKELESEFEQSFIGTEQSVLFEETIDGLTQGYTGNYIKVKVDGNQALHNEIKYVIIDGNENNYLIGHIK